MMIYIAWSCAGLRQGEGQPVVPSSLYCLKLCVKGKGFSTHYPSSMMFLHCAIRTLNELWVLTFPPPPDSNAWKIANDNVRYRMMPLHAFSFSWLPVSHASNILFPLFSNLWRALNSLCLCRGAFHLMYSFIIFTSLPLLKGTQGTAGFLPFYSQNNPSK